MAVFPDMGASLIVVANGLRLLNFQSRNANDNDNDESIIKADEF